MIWPMRLGQKYRNIFVRFLVQMKTSKSHSEFNWPLGKKVRVLPKWNWSLPNRENCSTKPLMPHQGITVLLKYCASRWFYLCIRLLISKTLVVFKISVAWKIKNWLYFIYWVISLASGTSVASMVLKNLWAESTISNRL